MTTQADAYRKCPFFDHDGESLQLCSSLAVVTCEQRMSAFGEAMKRAARMNMLGDELAAGRVC
ncbi:hypothetical protein ASG19_22710 [Rhizobium sp. Leaf306]|uniref:hypothetical protein n=1 Tax=Rhizobium sp. Leaf306 TaxID=1736330 RepID=UPI0007126307|nr:hypothetical protein [Rhizobium sp. Leaf306]KQQ33193.1 hypothetical protein ASG19_22710 [Rhizobium sp. Leaf306]